MPAKKKAKPKVKKAKPPEFVGRKVDLAMKAGVDPVTGTVDAFRTCFNMICDQDVFGDQSGSDVMFRRGNIDHYREAFEANLKGSDAYQQWWSRWSSRSDISDDFRFEFESEQDWVDRLVWVYDNLHTQGLV